MLENYKLRTVFPSLKGEMLHNQLMEPGTLGRWELIQWAHFAGRNVITSADTKHICHVNIENNVSE